MLTVSQFGRFGDLLWACPTLRALALVHGPVHLHLPGEFKSIRPLMEQQPYIDSVSWDDGWAVTPDHIIAPGYPEAVSLSYRGWPTLALPYEAHRLAALQTAVGPLDLETPWIKSEKENQYARPVAVGWTECSFELKLGLTLLLGQQRDDFKLLTHPNGKWKTVASSYVPVFDCTWVEAAENLRNSRLFFGDCSALHVLAVAMGIPAVIMEPYEPRLNDIFFPFGKDGPRVTLVRGNDGLATSNAGHCADAIQQRLEAL